MNGLTNDAKATRYSMLEYNMGAVKRLMVDSGLEDPVGLLVDVTDDYGKEIAKIVFDRVYGEGAKEKFIDQCENISRIPTMITVIPLELAKKILPATSHTALKHLNTPRPPDVRFIIAIAAGGNSYCGVHLPPGTVGKNIKDGQHKTGG